MGVFRWFGRLFGIVGDKANRALDSFEDPKAALDQVLRDMQSEIHSATQALGQAQAQAKKSRLDYETFRHQSEELRRSAENYLSCGDETRARNVLRRSKEAQKTAENFLRVAQRLEIEVEQMRESIQSKQMKLEEAKSKKHSLLSQKRIAENLTRLNRSSQYTDSGSAFAEFDRINEKIDEASTEAQVNYSLAMEPGLAGDTLLRESEVDLELSEMRKRLATRALEDKSGKPKKTLADLEDDDID